MTRNRVTATGVFLAALGALSAAQSGVNGDWEMTLTTESGVEAWQVRFEQSGDQLGGEIDIGDTVVSVDGTIDSATLKFVIVVADLDGNQSIAFEGERAGDMITGVEDTFLLFGTGAWTASRK